ncbi:DUF3060 domain-containing protein [Curtobacterium sp. GD1]|uniref:DUF3060 domain-containing protein n=1 Tax=Curtobacterium sp. GD1 TaxID=2810612 RepID=UPI001E4577F4|nr:DUF3060 domain-containing protein [Curtobacterium sp. GD1]MCC8907985.1 DUF3060 domain-containing protein [Curtobacterium sp. GD1]
MKKIFAASLTALAAVALLAGCTPSSTDVDPKASATPKPAASNTTSPANVCEDGTLTVTDAASAKRALAKGCDTVYLLTSNVELDLGPVKVLGIEGNGNTVAAESLATVWVMGTGNTISHGGEAPDTKGVAEGNTVAAK